VTEQQTALDWLYERYFKPKEEPKPKGSGLELTLDDQEIIDKAKAAKNGGKFSSVPGHKFCKKINQAGSVACSANHCCIF
jgi:hypothetical protein